MRQADFIFNLGWRIEKEILGLIDSVAFAIFILRHFRYVCYQVGAAIQALIVCLVYQYPL